MGVSFRNTVGGGRRNATKRDRRGRGATKRETDTVRTDLRRTDEGRRGSLETSLFRIRLLEKILTLSKTEMVRFIRFRGRGPKWKVEHCMSY